MGLSCLVLNEFECWMMLVILYFLDSRSFVRYELFWFVILVISVFFMVNGLFFVKVGGCGVEFF